MSEQPPITEKDAAGRRGCVVPKRHPGDAAVCATSCWQERIGKGHCPAEPLPDAEKDARAIVLGDLIARHDAYHVNEDGWTVCICGHVAEGDDDDGSHARHVAAVIFGGPNA